MFLFSDSYDCIVAPTQLQAMGRRERGGGGGVRRVGA